ncbi:hypothetical protein V6N11_050489 [Hibiscus sabdariffa]|uniref:Uncharacterized protein n=1 Tax=Hibiscus sabdariffa TaxID=183260 RepID=A0ABR2TA04_9ROSI
MSATRGRGFRPTAPYSPFTGTHSPVDARSEVPHDTNTDTVSETIPETVQTTSHDGSISQTTHTASYVSSTTPLANSSVAPSGAIVDSHGRVQVLLHGPFSNGKYEFLKRSYYRKPIGVAIKRHFHPYSFNWKSVPEETKQIYFDEFKKIFWWEPEKEPHVIKCWNRAAGVSYTEALHHWHNNTKTKPQCMSEEIWQSYINHWNSPEFKKKSEQAKKNRRRGDMEAKPLGSHTRGSISTIEWKERLEHRTGEPVGAFPLYKFTHTSKDDKDNGWFSDNHREFDNKYLQTIAAAQEAASADESSSASVDPNKIFLEISGGVSSKGRVFGVGSAAPIYYNTSQTSGSSQRSIPRNLEQQQEIDVLKEQLKQLTERQDAMMAWIMSQQQSQQQQQQQGYSQMLFEANYNGQTGFYPPVHHPPLYPGFSGMQPPMHPTTSMSLRPQVTYPPRGSTPFAHFVHPPTNEEEAYYPIPPSPQQAEINGSVLQMKTRTSSVPLDPTCVTQLSWHPRLRIN